MEKRVIIALILAFLIIYFYPLWLKFIGYKPYHKNDTVLSKDKEGKIAKIVHDTVHDTVNTTEISSGRLRLIFDIPNAFIKQIEYIEKFNEITNRIIIYSLYINNLGIFSETVSQKNWQYKTVSSNRIIFKNENFYKDFILNDVLIDFSSNSKNVILIPFFLKKGLERRFNKIFILTTDGKKEKISPYRLKKKKEYYNVKWFSFTMRYYSLIFQPLSNHKLVFQRGEGKKRDLVIAELIPLDDKEIRIKCYFGPNSQKEMIKYNKEWLEIVSYHGISRWIFVFLQKISAITGSYGWAIIGLSLLINMIFFPLTRRSLKSVKKMQEIQPQLNALRQQYKDKPQELQREMILLYRKYKINPLGGCLPLFFQFPIFFALYNTLMRAYELKGASFLIIKDLSQPDRLFSFFGINLNVLPILMGLFYFLQTKFSSRSMQGSWLFPLLFVALFYNFPSGLVLYWLMNSIIMLPIYKTKL